MNSIRRALRALPAALLAVASVSAWSDDGAIRKAWAERYPTARPIDDISKTPVPGLFELRSGADIYYSDDQGNYLLVASRSGQDGHLIDTRTRTDLTEERLTRQFAEDVSKMPFKDAIVRKQGNGSRRVMVFEDPNCHYCKDVERNLVALKDVTIYTFVIPILGPDSVSRSRDLWCSSDKAAAWRTWMLEGVMPPRSMGACDAAALDRNRALADRFRVTGTPAIVFDDGTRIAGSTGLEQLQKRVDQVGVFSKRG